MSRFIPFDFSSKISSLIPNFVTNNPIYQNTTARGLLTTIGAAYVASKVFWAAKTIFSNLYSLTIDLASRYGRNSWVVITGASDGIGKAFAFELAKKGFNIVLVGRSKEKLEGVEKELHAAVNPLQTRIVVADFGDSNKEGWAENIFDQVKDLDISILINNAGILVRGYLTDATLDDIRSAVLVNCLSHALLTRVFLPKLAGRAQRTAIINNSSIAALLPRPKISIYGASKIFLDYFSRALVYEHPNIDFLSLKPAPVQTRMQNNRDLAFNVISTEECARSALRALGRVQHTYGSWRHEVVAVYQKLVPKWYRIHLD